ncbi:WD40-repeat-containing domain protein [Fimicolochytrium jonesii]|uniref:WD40-repeat-containing domain protein n=1 Tax=Fimicolochytrium jonesii TaxID=1396493 RepID=UPI0022FE8E75|nr:WD40-repeat-containing domain protein [Fimicolochytrium jonesii]KAI8817194.1 WD40-repeat-containing domain protein [Fimicolochytrium jonesii]
MSFVLSAVLVGHDSDVKAVIAPTANKVVTASRDTSVISWSQSDSHPFQPESVFKGHSHFVNALAFIPPSVEHPEGLVVSGGSDKTIQVFDPRQSSKAIFSLVGHSNNICALTVAPNGDIISGSWDFTAKVWRNYECVTTVQHQQSVWGVLGLADGTYLTASADKSIKRWQGEKCLKTYAGHTDAVRGLALLSESSFVSCSNDATLRIWSIDGECIGELNGHDSFVYTVAVLPSGEIVSGGEDRSVRVWKGSECIQTILHPTPSVWSVAALPNGDIVSGASDHLARVFTRAKERQAAAEILKSYEDTLASQAIPSNQVGDVDKSKLPGLDALNKQGTKDGQVIMINFGGSIEAHQWSDADAKWSKVGEVVDAKEGKKTFEGKDYDYVFDVDLGDGAPALKLPYNVSDNPYQAAQQFIWRYELPQDYLDQVANFIQTNARAPVLGAAAPASAYQDPFTGGSRYVPGGAVASQAPTSTAPPPKPTSASTRFIPHEEFIFFKAAKTSAIASKIIQLNAELAKSMDFGPAALQTSEEKIVETLLEGLNKPATFKSNPTEANFDIILRVATQWPAASRFPGIDALRLIVLHSALPFKKHDLVAYLNALAGFADVKPNTGLGGKTGETNAMLTLRFLANVFATEEGRNFAWKQKGEIIELIKYVPSVTENTNVHVALATVYLNYAVLLKKTSANDEFGVELLHHIIEFLKTETDGESEFRALVAIGTLVHQNSDIKEAANVMGAREILRRATRTTGANESQLRQVERELEALLK